MAEDAIMPGLLHDLQRSALAGLLRLIDERKRAEIDFLARFDAQDQQTRARQQAQTEQLLSRQQQEVTAQDLAFKQEQQALNTRYTAEDAFARKGYVDAKQRVASEHAEMRTRIQADLRDALWTADSVLEAGQRRIQEQLATVKHLLNSATEHREASWQEVERILTWFDLEREELENVQVDEVEGDSSRDLQALQHRADALVRQMQHLRLWPWVRLPAHLAITLVFCLLGSLPALFFRPWMIWLTFGVAGAVSLTMAFRFLLVNLAYRRLRKRGRSLAVLLQQVQQLGDRLMRKTQDSSEKQRAATTVKHERERHRAESKYQPMLADLDRRMAVEREAVEQKHQAADSLRAAQFNQASEQSRSRHQTAMAELVARHQNETRQLESDQEAENAQALQARHQAVHTLYQNWKQQGSQILDMLAQLHQAGMPPEDTQQVASLSAALPVGTIRIDLPQLTEEFLLPGREPFPEGPLTTPAFLDFPRHNGFLLQAYAQGRAVAVAALQALMLRMLTTLPPGKVRFTIFDPVGLGDSFSAFMHLADHDEALVTSRIWTEAAHLEKQLADLTLHMENVIQKYLRSQFKSIEEYNAQAGEVAEPFRVLIIADFPALFTPIAIRRLLSILQSGGSCGVYVLMAADIRQPVPPEFRMADVERLCLTLRWQGQRFLWDDPDLDRFELTLDTPPESDRVIELVQRIGKSSRQAGRVQVPFRWIAPAEDQVWKGDSRRGIQVALGRAGAVRRLEMHLGQGTSQHVLVAGKTGSGKSTLWHALITNLALHYPPTEIELYLIDFKKGVEFKAYAEEHLPHARVIAIESEREFGLSVLQRLDAELRERGDRFRAHGVNDVASYRDRNPDQACPRIMLIVDEFQEFFIEDDRLSQEAALLLDRLVRQGRAFGLHVLLGSQTLGGAYSLARSTIDQMAVRIALQCSEADAQLILNKDNAAARLLSRPGEAIYNDAGGGLEGNEIFQVVWLPDTERDQILQRVRKQAEQTIPLGARPPLLVFESNAPAELERNALLARCLDGVPVDKRRGRQAWLGEAIAIKDPTAALFRAQTGSNLLIVGQQEETALALMAAALVSLVVQQPQETAATSAPSLIVLDGTGLEDANAGLLRRIAEGWPQTVRMVERAHIATVLAELTQEMNQRLKGAGERGSRYLFIQGIQRFREFRRTEDEMSFGRRGADKIVTPLEHLQGLLRDGPGVGIHVLMWCDMLVNLNRTLDRQGLRECGYRVVFQMNAADSSHLLDSPAASKLGRNRALLFHDEMAQPEKFRPYGLPSLAWLDAIKATPSVEVPVLPLPDTEHA